VYVKNWVTSKCGYSCKSDRYDSGTSAGGVMRLIATTTQYPSFLTAQFLQVFKYCANPEVYGYQYTSKMRKTAESTTAFLLTIGGTRNSDTSPGESASNMIYNTDFSTDWQIYTGVWYTNPGTSGGAIRFELQVSAPYAVDTDHPAYGEVWIDDIAVTAISTS
jgi:hypothetical protein